MNLAKISIQNIQSLKRIKKSKSLLTTLKLSAVTLEPQFEGLDYDLQILISTMPHVPHPPQLSLNF